MRTRSVLVAAAMLVAAGCTKPAPTIDATSKAVPPPSAVATTTAIKSRACDAYNQVLAKVANADQLVTEAVGAFAACTRGITEKQKLRVIPYPAQPGASCDGDTVAVKSCGNRVTYQPSIWEIYKKNRGDAYGQILDAYVSALADARYNTVSPPLNAEAQGNTEACLRAAVAQSLEPAGFGDALRSVLTHKLIPPPNPAAVDDGIAGKNASACDKWAKK